MREPFECNLKPTLSSGQQATKVMRIPLIEDLTTEPIPAGSSLMAVYDGGSQWYNALNTIAAGWLNNGGTFYYNVTAQPVDKLRNHLLRLGLKTDELEKNDKLRFADWYTATLGQKSKEKFSSDSLKVADLSIAFSKFIKDTFGPEVLRVWDSTSYLARYNDEKSLVEFVLSRPISAAYSKKSDLILSFIKGYHSEWVYRALERPSMGSSISNSMTRARNRKTSSSPEFAECGS